MAEKTKYLKKNKLRLYQMLSPESAKGAERFVIQIVKILQKSWNRLCAQNN